MYLHLFCIFYVLLTTEFTKFLTEPKASLMDTLVSLAFVATDELHIVDVDVSRKINYLLQTILD